MFSMKGRTMNLSSSESRAGSATKPLIEKTLAKNEILRENRTKRSKVIWQLLQTGAWSIVAGIFLFFLHLFLYNLTFTYETLVVDIPAAILIFGGALLCLASPAIANRS